MLRKFRDLDADTVLADGPKFDLAKVTEMALGILRALQDRVRACFQENGPHTFVFPSDEQERLLDEQGYTMIDWVFSDCQIASYDVTPYCCSTHLGPFAIDLYLLGMDYLHGNMIGGETDQELPWEELDPTPVLMIMAERAMIDPLREDHLDFLRWTLDGYAFRGVTWELKSADEDVPPLAIVVRFPHAAFGKGRGTLKICRYQPEDDFVEEESHDQQSSRT